MMLKLSLYYSTVSRECGRKKIAKLYYRTHDSFSFNYNNKRRKNNNIYNYVENKTKQNETLYNNKKSIFNPIFSTYARHKGTQLKMTH